MSQEMAQKYWDTRSKESRAASACSEQSAEIESREKLLENYENIGKICEKLYFGSWTYYLKIRVTW